MATFPFIFPFPPARPPFSSFSALGPATARSLLTSASPLGASAAQVQRCSGGGCPLPRGP